MRRFACVMLTACLALAFAAPVGAEVAFDWTLRIAAEGSLCAETMCLLPDGGAYLAGFVEGEADCGEALGGQDAYLAYVDAQGNVVWQHRYGGSGNERFTRVIEGLGGGCLALGVTNSEDEQCRASRGMQDAFLARVDENGDLLWTKCLGGSLDDELTNVTLWEEGGYLVCGRSKSRNGDLGANYGGWDAWAMLLSEADGKPQWVVRYGDVGDDAFSLILTEYDCWIFMGTMTVFSESEEEGAEPVVSTMPIAVAVNGTGEILWEQTLGGTGVSIVTAAREMESGWLLAGETNSTSALMPAGHGGMDLWMLQMRQNGTISVQRTYGGEANENLFGLYAADEGGFLFLASTQSKTGQVSGTHGAEDIWAVRTTAAGALQWQQALGGSGWSAPAGAIGDGMGGWYILGSTVSQDGDIGAHPSMRTGFLAHLASNGNLLSVDLIGGSEEFSAVSIDRSDEGAYLLGVIRQAEPTGIVNEIWLAKLAQSVKADTGE